VTDTGNEPADKGTSESTVRTTRLQNALSMMRRARVLVAPYVTRTRVLVVTIFPMLVAIALGVPKIREFYGGLRHPESNTEIHVANSESTSIDLDVYNAGRKASHIRDECRIAFGDLPIENAMLEIHPDDKANTTVVPGQHLTVRLIARGLSARV
jgi:hypothetical protein